MTKFVQSGLFGDVCEYHGCAVDEPTRCNWTRLSVFYGGMRCACGDAHLRGWLRSSLRGALLAGSEGECKAEQEQKRVEPNHFSFIAPKSCQWDCMRASIMIVGRNRLIGGVLLLSLSFLFQQLMLALVGFLFEFLKLGESCLCILGTMHSAIELR